MIDTSKNHAEAFFNQMASYSASAMRTNLDSFRSTGAKAIELGSELASVFTASGKAFVNGAPTIVEKMAELSHAELKLAAETTKAVFAAKSVREVVDIHSNAAKQAVIRGLGNTKTVADHAVKLVEEVSAPMVAHTEKALKSVKI